MSKYTDQIEAIKNEINVNDGKINELKAKIQGLRDDEAREKEKAALYQKQINEHLQREAEHGDILPEAREKIPQLEGEISRINSNMSKAHTEYRIRLIDGKISKIKDENDILEKEIDRHNYLEGLRALRTDYKEKIKGKLAAYHNAHGEIVGNMMSLTAQDPNFQKSAYSLFPRLNQKKLDEITRFFENYIDKAIDIVSWKIAELEKMDGKKYCRVTKEIEKTPNQFDYNYWPGNVVLLPELVINRNLDKLKVLQ